MVNEMGNDCASNVAKRIDDLEVRVSKLERILPNTRENNAEPSVGSKGPSNAIGRLIYDGYLNEPKPVKEVHNELSRQGYHYTLQIVDCALRRMNRRKILTRVGKRGEWKYVVRR
jgi:hypothetical protein